MALHAHNSHKPSRLARFFALSLVAHALIFLWSFVRPPSEVPNAPTPPAPIEITSIPESELPPTIPPSPSATKRPEVAETEEANNNDTDPQARFLSDRNQKAQVETRAAQTDDFRKKQGTGFKDSLSKSNAPPPSGDPDEKGSDDQEGIEEVTTPGKTAGVKRNWKSLSLKDLGLGGDGGMLAATDDRLDGVATGDKTVLSTREFKYFSYYHRIKETLRQYWKPGVERRLALLWGKGAQMKEGELVTQVLVTLTREGKLASIRQVGSSGFKDLDDAATDAFERAAPFPNPPEGMIEADGMVHIRWDFILRTQGSPQIGFRRPSGGMP